MAIARKTNETTVIFFNDILQYSPGEWKVLTDTLNKLPNKAVSITIPAAVTPDVWLDLKNSLSGGLIDVLIIRADFLNFTAQDWTYFRFLLKSINVYSLELGANYLNQLTSEGWQGLKGALSAGRFESIDLRVNDLFTQPEQGFQSFCEMIACLNARLLKLNQVFHPSTPIERLRAFFDAVNQSTIVELDAVLQANFEELAVQLINKMLSFRRNQAVEVIQAAFSNLLLHADKDGEHGLLMPLKFALQSKIVWIRERARFLTLSGLHVMVKALKQLPDHDLVSSFSTATPSLPTVSQILVWEYERRRQGRLPTWCTHHLNFDLLSEDQWLALGFVLKSLKFSLVALGRIDFTKETWEKLTRLLLIGGIKEVSIEANDERFSTENLVCLKAALHDAEITAFTITNISYLPAHVSWSACCSIVENTGLQSIRVAFNGFYGISASRWGVFCEALQSSSVKTLYFGVGNLADLYDDGLRLFGQALSRSNIQALTMEYVPTHNGKPSPSFMEFLEYLKKSKITSLNLRRGLDSSIAHRVPPLEAMIQPILRANERRLMVTEEAGLKKYIIHQIWRNPKLIQGKGHRLPADLKEQMADHAKTRSGFFKG